MQEISAPESTNVIASTVFRVCDGEINCIGIFIDFRDEDTRTGETVIVDRHQGMLGNIWSMESERGEK